MLENLVLLNYKHRRGETLNQAISVTVEAEDGEWEFMTPVEAMTLTNIQDDVCMLKKRWIIHTLKYRVEIDNQKYGPEVEIHARILNYLLLRVR